MENYLGEVPLDISQHPIYSKYTEKDWALNIIANYGQVNGADHKAWVIDQVAQVLLGTPMTMVTASWGNGHTEERESLGNPSLDYVAWRKKYRDSMMAQDDKEDDPDYDDCYDQGIAP